jgi:hypothetical protein
MKLNPTLKLCGFLNVHFQGHSSIFWVLHKIKYSLFIKRFVIVLGGLVVIVLANRPRFSVSNPSGPMGV